MMQTPLLFHEVHLSFEGLAPVLLLLLLLLLLLPATATAIPLAAAVATARQPAVHY
jgi:hypothetical protein